MRPSCQDAVDVAQGEPGSPAVIPATSAARVLSTPAESRWSISTRRRADQRACSVISVSLARAALTDTGRWSRAVWVAAPYGQPGRRGNRSPGATGPAGGPARHRQAPGQLAAPTGATGRRLTGPLAPPRPRAAHRGFGRTRGIGRSWRPERDHRRDRPNRACRAPGGRADPPARPAEPGLRTCGGTDGRAPPALRAPLARPGLPGGPSGHLPGATGAGAGVTGATGPAGAGATGSHRPEELLARPGLPVPGIAGPSGPSGPQACRPHRRHRPGSPSGLRAPRRARPLWRNPAPPVRARLARPVTTHGRRHL